MSDQASQPAGGSPLSDPAKPWRTLPPDAQAFDEVRIVTVPRYKESYLSGDEWRISARIQLLRKGHVVFERSARDVDSAVRYLDCWAMQAGENGEFSLAKNEYRDLCDQEGCSAKATVTYRMRKRYTRSEGVGYDPHSVTIRRFCDRHARRGDCGLDDADSNYEEVTLNEDGTIAEKA